jgi:hypothetical protein
MSLYKDASLVMIPSAYKDGKLYSIRPVPEYGNEEVTNGDFDTDSDWTKEAGWTISGGKASYNGSATTNALYQNISAVSGKTYRVKFSVVNYVSGSFKAFISNGSATGSSPLISGNGDYVFDITATGILIVFRNVTSFNGSIDNVSVQEITKSGDFTFSRGSNLAATRVDVNGLIEKGRENLLLQSNQFDTTWATSVDITATSGQAGYDGSNDAWLLKRSSNASRFIYQNLSASSSVYTLSFYGKPESEDWVYLYSFNGSSAITAYFDLQNGVVGITSGSVISTNIEAAGNGYYRCSLTYSTSVSQVRIYPAVGNGSVTGGVTDAGVYIQDAQLEQGLVATDYIETGATTAQAGILEDMPRLDYSGGASCPSLLLEPQRSNLIDNSEYLEGTLWAGAGTTLTANAGTSPEGLNNAYEIEFASSGSAYWYKNGVYVTYSAGASYTWSLYVKSNAQVIKWGGATPSGTDSYSSEDVGDGWYRQIITRTFTSAGTNALIQPLFDYVNIGRSTPFQVYGAQLEAGSYPTSYIPTYGSSVTRSTDTSSLTGFDFFPNGEGTAMIEFELDEITISGYPELFRINNPSDATDFVFCYIFEPSAGDVKIGYRLDVDNDKKIEASRSIALGTNKIVVRIQRGACTAYLNGVEIPPSQTYNGVADVNMTSLRINAQSFIANERIKQFVTFPTPLTDSEMVALTTL